MVPLSELGFHGGFWKALVLAQGTGLAKERGKGQRCEMCVKPRRSSALRGVYCPGMMREV